MLSTNIKIQTSLVRASCALVGYMTRIKFVIEPIWDLLKIEEEMGRWGDGEIGRWGDGEMRRWGDGEMGR